MCGNMCASMCRQNVQKWGTSKYTKQSKKIAYLQEVKPCKTTLLDGNHPFWDLAENVLKQIEQFPTDTQEGCVIHTGMLVLWQGGQIAAVRLKTLDRAEEVVVMIGALHLGNCWRQDVRAVEDHPSRNEMLPLTNHHDYNQL